jgi:hypothetical protein
MKPPDAKKNFELEVVYRLETLVQSFATFSCSTMYVPRTGVDQIIIAAPNYDKMHVPSVWVLNQAASDI